MKLLNNYIKIKQIDNTKKILDINYYKKGYTELKEQIHPNEAIVIDGNDLIENGATIHYFPLGLIGDDIIKYQNIFLFNNCKLLKKGIIVKRLEVEQKIGILTHTIQDFFLIVSSNCIYTKDNLVIVKSGSATSFYSNGERFYFVHENDVLLFIDGKKISPAKNLNLVVSDSNKLYKEKLMDLSLLDNDYVLVKDIVGKII